jgi:hypothetical protein
MYGGAGAAIVQQVALGVQEIADRSYWEQERGSIETVKVADDVLDLIESLVSGYELKYNKFYIGLARNNQVDNIVIFRPSKEVHQNGDSFATIG